MKKRNTQLAKSTCRSLTVVGLFSLSVVLPALAQEPFVYPAQGQSAAKMATDKAECQGWATQQTGFDPLATAMAPASPSNQPQQGGALRGGARGAAGGAAIGAIAGDAGKGAAIGAAAGGLLGGARRRHQQQEAEQAQAQQAQAQSQQLNTYLRAYGACLKGRGYAVE